tara:strand:- start:1302 stop:1712 length:411 start_codon:yes stop_codon:yes gene_type:complete
MGNQRAPLAHTIISLKKNSLACGKSWSSEKHLRRSKSEIIKIRKKSNPQLEIQRTFFSKLPVLTEGINMERLSKLDLKANVSKTLVSQITKNKSHGKKFYSRIANSLFTSNKDLSKRQKSREELYSKVETYYARKR